MANPEIIGFWLADPSVWGGGKVHAIDREPHEDGEIKTFCGLRPGQPNKPKACPGKRVSVQNHNCKSCQRAIDSRIEYEQNRVKWEAQAAQREAEYQKRRAEYAQLQAVQEWQRKTERELWLREFKAWYDSYLRSERWRITRQQILSRANGICEGCGEDEPKEVHHMTYEHVGNEFNWELRAVCEDCHQRFHETSHIPWTHGDYCHCEFCKWKASQKASA